jgi:hypothetical protein
MLNNWPNERVLSVGLVFCGEGLHLNRISTPCFRLVRVDVNVSFGTATRVLSKD